MAQTLTVAAFAIAAAFSLSAQGPSPAAGRGGRGNMPPPIVSCEVKPDRTVTFRLNAPEATDVKVGGDFAQGAQQMTKGDNGIWSVTVGPLNPAIYSYTFRVNGVAVLDPANPAIKLGERSEPRWDTGPTPQDEGPLDCLIYDHQAKSFDGIWDGTEIDAVDALAKFVLTKLRVPAH